MRDQRTGMGNHAVQLCSLLVRGSFPAHDLLHGDRAREVPLETAGIGAP